MCMTCFTLNKSAVKSTIFHIKQISLCGARNKRLKKKQSRNIKEIIIIIIIILLLLLFIMNASHSV